MKRWAPWLALVLVVCAVLLSHRSTSPGLLQDSDTVGLLAGIRERDNPWSWFVGDWPIFNHFYRPISTLTLEFDNAVYGDQAWGYGLTNVLLCMGAVLALFWLLRETTETPWMAGTGAALFGLWHIGWPSWLSTALVILAWTSWLGLLRGRERLGAVVLAFLSLWFASQQLAPIFELYSRMVAWIPGRTASTMTLFALLGMAAYARWERCFASRVAPVPQHTDPPVSKSEPARAKPRALQHGWLIGSVLFTALALGSYEQAVILPAAMLGVAVLLFTRGYRPAWWAQSLFWAVLVGYLVLRAQVVPTEISAYQAQQLRHGWSVWHSMLDYLAPGWFGLRSAWIGLETSWLNLLFGTVIFGIVAALANVAAWVTVWSSRERWLALGFALLAAGVFLPMAWLKHFEHYHYWSAAMRSTFVVLLVAAGCRAWLSAVSPPAVQAPARHHPSPGSLPRR